MGNILVPMVPVVVGIAAQVLSLVFRRPDRQNPTHVDIEALHQARAAQRRAEQSAREAREVAEEIRRQAEQDREQARIRQEEADQAAAEAARELEKMRAEIEEAVSTANRAKELSEAAVNLAREDAMRIGWEAEDERERCQRMREDTQRTMAAMRQEADKAQQVADEQRLQAEAGRVEAERLANIAAEEMRKAKEAKEEAERRLKEGIQPVITPTPAELSAAKKHIQYRDDCFHFAVAGVSGSGKSSLVNAFRGLRGTDTGAAAVGVTETTLQMTRYPDPDPNRPFVWYDIPGAGTIKCRDWQYFNDQGLYVFDCIIVLFDNRFTMTDVAILMNARRFNIPTYIVRSKADQHIRNVMVEMGYDSEGGDEDTGRRNKMYKAARKQFIEDTRKSVRSNLEAANLPDQRVYIVSNLTMLGIVLQKMPKKTVDEVELLNDLLSQAYSRRGARSDKPQPAGESNGV